ncbi:MAG: PAS domain S-box protein [Burkholderiales bacterium]|nr:PAS domain S-box protein [Burkholderiales bacterium]
MTSHPEGSQDHRFRLLVESVVDYAIFMLDPAGTVLTWNIGAERLKGYSAEEIIGRPFTVFYPPEAVASGWPRHELEIAERNQRYEEEGWRVRKDGSTFWASVVITALRGPDGRLEGFAKVTRDLSEKRLREEALRQSEEQFRLLLESVNDYAIFMLDPEGAILTWNHGAAAIKGYAASEVLGRNFRMFFTAQDILEGKPEAELHAARTQGRAESEGWRVRKDGAVFWANAVLTPVHDGEGRLRGFAKVTRDLSEQRRVREVEQEGRRMQEFIAMLAHELRNPLAPIRNAVSLLQDPSLDVGARQEATSVMDRQLGLLTHLVDDLLDVGRIATGKISLRDELLDYRQVVMLSVESARDAIDGRGHALRVDLPEGPIALRGDPTRLTQALLNLLTNAAKYTPDGGRLGLKVGIEGGTVVAAVSDNGRGVAPEARDRIFDLFTQERQAGGASDPGLGIGLALARALIEQHGGQLTVESPGPGQGSTFHIRLPIGHTEAADPVAGDAAAEQESEAMAPLQALVVDDNRDAADTLSLLLETLGHACRTAYGARQALEVAREFAADVVFLDLNMPDGDGVSVLPRLRAILGDTAYVAALTGYGQKHDREITRAAGFQEHLTKPVEMSRLQATLAAAGERRDAASAPRQSPPT